MTPVQEPAMKLVAIIAIVGAALIDLFGGVPGGSVGGPMAIAMLVLGATFVFGLANAWSRRLGIGGWITSVVSALIGGFAGAAASGMVVVPLLSPFAAGTSIAAAGPPLSTIALVLTMGLALAGAWVALWLVRKLT
jgi:drug/metabolite transporter (DMT)-like permease